MGGIPSILLPKGNTTKTDHSFLRVVCFCITYLLKSMKSSIDISQRIGVTETLFSTATV